jgi:hypothetical protein
MALRVRNSGAVLIGNRTLEKAAVVRGHFLHNGMGKIGVGIVGIFRGGVAFVFFCFLYD